MEIFNEYYQLKSEYEEMEQERIQKIRNNRKLSRMEKRNRFKKSKLVCIRCKQDGGTIFTNTYNADEMQREMTARCGHLEAPCDLYLLVKCGDFYLMNEAIRRFELDIERIKREIVVLKNKILFGYKDESIDEFEALKEEMNSFVVLLEENIRDIFVDDSILNALLETNLRLIESIKELVNEGDFDDAVSLYIDQLLSNLKQLRETKYKRNMMVESDKDTYILLQLPTTIESMEKTIDKPSITRTRVSSVVPKTNDVPKTSDLDSMVSEGADVQFELTEDGVVFDNETHQEIFNGLSDEYQMQLILEDDWLIDTIAKYAKSGKPYTFVPAPKLKFPPTLKPDGTYSFGNTIYNEEFAKLPNKETILSRNDLKTYMDDLVGKRLLA